ncbi:MAG: ABC transporter ATP-binding protein [Phycisphaerae bacterium]|nr:ABC transporter ATP-binding protein [Phycisphaerae bacterium]
MSDIVLETKNLTKYYGRRLALDHLNLRVPRGCIYGLLGRNGAGKTTAIKLLLGLLRPTCGGANVLGCDCQYLTPQIRQRVGYVTEGHRLYRWMTIGRLEKFQRAFFPGGQWNGWLVDEMLEYFELSKTQNIKHLSNGQRAQVSLALAIAPNP